MTPEKVIKEFKKTKFAREGGSCFESCDYEEMFADLKFFIFASHASAIKEEIGRAEGKKVGHGNYHCGIEECCGKLTKKKILSEKLSDAECKGYNSALQDHITHLQEKLSDWQKLL